MKEMQENLLLLNILYSCSIFPHFLVFILIYFFAVLYCNLWWAFSSAVMAITCGTQANFLSKINFILEITLKNILYCIIKIEINKFAFNNQLTSCYLQSVYR